jgi:hypothetical protein
MGKAAYAPIRKVIAAAIAAVLSSAAALAVVTSGEGDWRSITSAVVPAVLTVLVAYFAPPDERQAVQAIVATGTTVAAVGELRKQAVQLQGEKPAA